MKNELGPLLGEGTQENLSFQQRCPLSPWKRLRGKNHREEGGVRKERREDFMLGISLDALGCGREHGRKSGAKSSVDAQAGARSCWEMLSPQELSGEGLALWEP